MNTLDRVLKIVTESEAPIPPKSEDDLHRHIEKHFKTQYDERRKSHQINSYKHAELKSHLKKHGWDVKETNRGGPVHMTHPDGHHITTWGGNSPGTRTLFFKR